jgi:hypothetical protein
VGNHSWEVREIHGELAREIPRLMLCGGVGVADVGVRLSLTAAAKRYGRRSDGVLGAQLRDERRPVGIRLRCRAVGEALLCALAAEGGVAERLVAVLREDQQRAHLLTELPHQPRVVDVLLDWALVPGVEQDRPRRSSRGFEAAVRRVAPPLVIHAVALREGAGRVAEVVDLLREVSPSAVDRARPTLHGLGLAPPSDRSDSRSPAGGAASGLRHAASAQ